MTRKSLKDPLQGDRPFPNPGVSIRTWPARALLWLWKEDRPLALLSGFFFVFTSIRPVFPLHLFVLVPTLASLVRAGSDRAMLRRAWFAGLALSAFGFLWMWSLLVYSLLAPILYGVAVLYSGATYALALGASECIRRRTGWPLWVVLPPLWMLREHVMTFGEIALPTEPWSHLLTFNPALLQFTEWTGTLGAALWVVVVNGLLVESWQAFRTRRRLTAAATAGAALLAAMAVPIYGTVRMAQVGRELERAARSCDIAVVQTNLDLFIKHDMARAEENTSLIVKLARAAAPGSDLVILPESVLPGYLLHRLSQSERPDAGPLAELAVETGVPILAGRFYVRVRSAKDFDAYNAALVVGPDGEVRDWYGKIQLVPIIEGLPYLHYLGLKAIPLGVGGLLGQLGGFTIGGNSGPIVCPPARGPTLGKEGDAGAGKKGSDESGGRDGGLRAGVVICYESLFPELSRRQVARGADLMVCLSEDSWYGHSYAAGYMSRTLVSRAIETRRSWARAANTGVSGFVTPDGVYSDATPLWTRAVIRRRLPLSSEMTFFVRHGNWLAVVAAGWTLLLVVAAWASSLKSR